MLELSAELRARVEARVSPYGRVLLERAAEQALHLHADEVGVEHLVGAMMADDACAAHRAVVFAFADPETIAEEVRALAAGILVTGSAASLPFSAGGVRALEAARALGGRRGGGAVGLPHLLHGAFGALPAELRGELEAAGYEVARVEEACGAPREPLERAAGEALFRSFDEDAKRALSAAARLARQAREETIGPAPILLACLQARPEVERASGLSASRARLLLRGRTRDASLPARRPVEPDEALARFVAGLPAGAGSLQILAHVHSGGTPELAQLLARHKVTTALLERAAAGFADPSVEGAAPA